MENYISRDYFSKIEALLAIAKNDILTNKASNKNALFQLLSALPLHINLNDLEIESYAKTWIGNKNYTSFKDIIISNALKNQQLHTYKSETSDFKESRVLFIF